MHQSLPVRREERDRFVDLLRVAAISLVVLGHWLMAVVFVQDGELVVGRILTFLPWTQWGTWAFQVMPLFFLVGGFVNAGSWLRAVERGEAWPTWVRRRARRLLRPLLPVLAFWLPFGLLLSLGGLPQDRVALASQAAFLPVWFLGVYLLTVAVVPLTWHLHRRLGLLAVGGFVAVAAGVDALSRAGVPFVELVNASIVWAGIHQIGYFWYEARLPEGPATGFALFAVGIGAVLALVLLGGYPVSMVAVGGGEPSNASPPTVALFALALAELGLLVAARRPLSRWLQRPRVWAGVAVAGRVTLTVYLWHMTAFVLVTALVVLTGAWPETEGLDRRWWALRPLWIALCAATLAALVAVFGRFEDAGEPPPSAAPGRAVFGLAVTLAGILLLVQRGLYAPGAPVVAPLAVTAVLLAGLAALGVLQPRGRAADRSA